MQQQLLENLIELQREVARALARGEEGGQRAASTPSSSSCPLLSVQLSCPLPPALPLSSVRCLGLGCDLRALSASLLGVAPGAHGEAAYRKTVWSRARAWQGKLLLGVFVEGVNDRELVPGKSAAGKDEGELC